LLDVAPAVLTDGTGVAGDNLRQFPDQRHPLLTTSMTFSSATAVAPYAGLWGASNLSAVRGLTRGKRRHSPPAIRRSRAIALVTGIIGY